MIAVLCATALAVDPAPIVARVEAHYAKVQSLRAEFVQTVRSPLYGDDVQKGSLAIARPGRMRWDFTGDGRVYLISDAVVSIWTPAENQLLRYPYTPTGADSLLQSLDRVDELFAVTAPEQPVDGGIVLDLRSKTDATGGATVRLALAPDLALRTVTLTDPSGTRTELVFSAVATDVTLPASTWTLATPPGVRVIDSGG